MKPTFIGIGAQKCASSWLYEVLRDHPDVCLSPEKEVNFFSYNFDRGYQWYERHFPQQCDGKKAVGEVSPSYFHNPSVPAYARDYNPDLKIIALLRHPVKRAISNHKHDIRTGNFQGNDLSFEAGLRNNPSYIDQGLYATHLKRWLAFFPKEQVKVIIVDDIIENPQKVVEDVYEFLSIDTGHVPEALHKRANVSYAVRWRWLSKIVNRLGNILRHGPLNGLWWLASRLGFRKIYHAINAKPVESAHVELTSEEKRNLENVFSDQIDELEKLLARDLSSWK